MPYNSETVSRRIKAGRALKGWTQEDLAEFSGVKHANIARYETGETIPGLDNAYKIAAALGKSLNWLCDLPDPDLHSVNT